MNAMSNCLVLASSIEFSKVKVAHDGELGQFRTLLSTSLLDILDISCFE